MSRTIHSSDNSIPSKHILGMRPTLLLRWKLCSSLKGWTSRCNKKSANNQACQKESMIWLPLQRSSDPTWIVSPNHPCQGVLVLHLPLLLNLSKVMRLLPAFRMKMAVGKRFFAPIVEKATKKRNVGRNLAMLGNAKGQAQWSWSTGCNIKWVWFRSSSGKRQELCLSTMTRGGSCGTRSTSSRGYCKWSQSYSKRNCGPSLSPASRSCKSRNTCWRYTLKTYSVFHERLQITHSFSTHLDARDPLTSANIEVSFSWAYPSFYITLPSWISILWQSSDKIPAPPPLIE